MLLLKFVSFNEWWQIGSVCRFVAISLENGVEISANSFYIVLFFLSRLFYVSANISILFYCRVANVRLRGERNYRFPNSHLFENSACGYFMQISVLFVNWFDRIESIAKVSIFDRYLSIGNKNIDNWEADSQKRKFKTDSTVSKIRNNWYYWFYKKVSR